ncbi:MAG: alpha-2-macroglobulin family protein, partial [Planctomycetota bacterium]
FILRTDRPSYAAGETVKVEIVAAGAGEVLVDLIKDRQTLLTRSVSIDGGRGTLALDLPAELSGLLHLHAYRLDRDSEWVGRDVLIAVRPAGELKVAVTADSQTYRPGEAAKLRFEVTDSSGAAGPAALSLAAVDEAVFSLQQAAPGLEAVLAGLDEELLAPAVEVHGFSPALAPRSDNYARAMLAAAKAAAPRPSPMVWGNAPWVDPAAGKTHSLDADNRRDQARDFKFRREDALTAAGVASGLAAGGVLVALVVAICLADPIGAFGSIGRRVLGTGWKVLAILGLIALVPAILLPSLGHPGLPWMGWLSVRSGGEMAASGAAAMPLDKGATDTPGASTPPPGDSARLRTYFPETMLWRPQVITDESGRAELSIPLPDSITTWRVSGSAVSKVGRLGRVAGSVRVFQPFFVDVNAPLSLTAGDEVSVPLVLYNYTDQNLEVYLKATGADGLAVLDKDISSVLVTPGVPRRVYVRARAGKPGPATLTVKASAGAVADAIRREIRIVAPGLPRWQAFNGTLAEGDQAVDLLVPADAVPDSVAVRMKIYPSTFSELIDGLENILRMPHGCFEQTSSTTYPNVMALSYMKARGIASPATAAKARRYIHLGYQRLLSFEVKGGGVDWFGNPPANVMLTAEGLMEFADMARVHSVDPKLLRRTADWLGRQQRADGSWQLPGRSFHEPFTGGDASPLAATAYVTWALATCDPAHPAAKRGAAYLAASWGSTQNPCTLALCANALLAVDPRSAAGLAAARKLADRARPAGAGQCFFPADGGQLRRRPGGMMDVTSTALAALALMTAGERADLVQDSLGWLAGQRDPHGTWSSPMPTVLALKALLAGAE